MELTDDELLAAELKLTDPFQQRNLAEHIPEDATVVDIINIYVWEGYPATKVMCAWCGKPRHKRGYTARLSNGQLALLGSTCGSEYAGEAWKTYESKLVGKLDRQYYLRALQRLKDTGTDDLRELRAIRRKLDHFDALHRRFQKVMPDPYELLRQRFGSGLPVLEIRKLRRNSAYVASASSNGVPQFIEETTFRHRVQGLRFFQSATPLALFDKSLGEIETLYEIAYSDKFVETGMLRKAFVKARRAAGDIADLVDAHNAQGEFFNAPNLRGLAEWLNSNLRLRGSYMHDANGLLYQDGKGELEKVHLPPPHPVIDPTMVRKVSAILSPARVIAVDRLG